MRGVVAVLVVFVGCTGRGPQVAPEPVSDRFARAEGEWQGMLPERDNVWPCMPDGACGQARACIAGKCLPCLQDAECVGGERCVLEHCVRAELVACTRRRDCGEADTMCILSGYTPLDVRGNADMRAYCPSSRDPKPSDAELEAEAAMQAAQTVPAEPTEPTGPTAGERLLEQLRARARQRTAPGGAREPAQ